MKYLKCSKVMLAGIFSLTSLFSMGTSGAMPHGEFACKVLAQGGRIGLVMVQADTRAQAAKAALGAEAFTTDKIRSRAVSVVECIDYRNERFADYQFQQFFERLDG